MSLPRVTRPWMPLASLTALAFGLFALSLAEAEPSRAAKEEGKLPRSIKNSLGMKLVLVPAGKFRMGSPETEKGHEPNETLHEVVITRPFYLGSWEVTQAEYEAVMFGGELVFERPFSPVDGVSWKEAAAFCQRLSDRTAEKKAGRVYRLPTEAEWEYACREAGAKKGPFHFGGSLTSHQANIDGNHPWGTDKEGPYLRRTTKVESYPANALGLHDMHGNVWEWCADWWGDYPKGPVTDPKGPPKGTIRVIRGGGWRTHARYCRSASRDYHRPDSSTSYIGFRVALSVPER